MPPKSGNYKKMARREPNQENDFCRRKIDKLCGVSKKKREEATMKMSLYNPPFLL
jgi:hypothetical protein